ncbi:flagellar basal body L-ring protein FlgH [Erythrobacter sp. HA6-11]
MPVETGVQPPAASTNGAIFQPAYGYAGLIEGTRARRVGDMLTVVLVESVDTTKRTTARTQRDGSASITPPTAGPLSFLNPNALKAASEASFRGQGQAAQSSSLNGAVAVTIAEVRSNGTARVVGEKQMSLSQGEEWIQFAGTVRLADIDGDNRLLSSQVADAQIIYSGRGSIQRASRPGWLSRFFSAISPW